MRHIFLDTNIVIDFLADRKPFSETAAKIFTMSLNKKVIIYISSLSYTNIYYVLRKYNNHIKVIKLLKQLFEFVEIIEVTKTNILDALHSEFLDFEDAVQYFCALSVKKIDLIITRDEEGFQKSKLSVMSPMEALISLSK